MNSNEQKLINEVINHRAIDIIYPSKDAFGAALKNGERMRIYIGADATGPHIHLGHLTNLLILKKIQELGHEVIFLIGDFTARIGDPTDKLASRIPLTEGEVKENYKAFKKQISKILDIKGKNPIKIKFNSKWLSKMTLEDVIRLGGHFTVQQMIERDMFQDRIKAGKSIGLHEFLYPLMQGYDSLVMNVDAEMGGTDQTFNMLVGREISRIYKKKEKFVLTTKLLVNPSTGKKIMNKSEGGLINLDDTAEDIFGKTMALPDEAIFPVAKFCTELSSEKIDSLMAAMKKGRNPRDVKSEIAVAVVSVIYDGEKAETARASFEKIFSKKEIPTDIPELKIKNKNILPVDLIVLSGIFTSKSEARRLIEQGGFDINGESQKDPRAILSLKGGEVLKVGKKRFFKVKLCN